MRLYLSILNIAPFMNRSESVYIFEPFGGIYINGRRLGYGNKTGAKLSFEVKSDVRIMP